ncbi:hypothetical protein [Streptomonospora litoralis]|uniref:Uncharacterized protein n=1 Tax=Streptomonospora litoralis TaxID=2498135 RepID=A0A4P6Q999_9ACTN|nr:hypothetical protein [Streptomonospora litoralis]QBI55774.1 hypothetical protein EKD16_20055 [Streptomonospora litoralis]
MRPYVPQPAHAPAPASTHQRGDHTAFCEIAEAHSHAWPEIRRLPGPLYVAADRPNGLHVSSDDLGAFAAALAAHPHRTAGSRPYPPHPRQAPR